MIVDYLTGEVTPYTKPLLLRPESIAILEQYDECKNILNKIVYCHYLIDMFIII